jgi:hypothetical protein
MTLFRPPPPDAPDFVMSAYLDLVDGRREGLRNSSSVGSCPLAHGVAIARPFIVVVGIALPFASRVVAGGSVNGAGVMFDVPVVVGKARPASCEGAVTVRLTCSLLHFGVRNKLPILYESSYSIGNAITEAALKATTANATALFEWTMTNLEY